MPKEVLGIDIGGVIIDRMNDGTDTSFFGSNYLKTTAVPEAFEAIHRLITERFGESVYLVSKCGANVQAKSLEWLVYNRFYEQTGVLVGHERFCRKRNEKAGICKELGITHFIDDRLEVLSYLLTVKYRLLFQPNKEEVRKFAQHLDTVQTVYSWNEVLKLLL